MKKFSKQVSGMCMELVVALGLLTGGFMTGIEFSQADQAQREQEIKDLKQVTRVLADDGVPTAQPANLVMDRIIDPPLAMKHEVRLFIDERTGCHYLVAGGLFQPTTMMARRYSDGVQVCDEH